MEDIPYLDIAEASGPELVEDELPSNITLAVCVSHEALGGADQPGNRFRHGEHLVGSQAIAPPPVDLRINVIDRRLAHLLIDLFTH